MSKKRKRRTWSDDEKAMICRQAQMPGVSVSQVARRYNVNSNLVFKWLNAGRSTSTLNNDDGDAAFLPVEIVAEPVEFERPVQAATASSPSLVISTVEGLRLCVDGDYDPELLAHLLKRLSS